MLAGNTPVEIYHINVGTAQSNQTDEIKWHSHFMRHAVMDGWVLLLSPFTGAETEAQGTPNSLGQKKKKIKKKKRKEKEKKKRNQLSVGWTTDRS